MRLIDADRAPTVEAKPIVRGQWLDRRTQESDAWECSACGGVWSFTAGAPWDCGARFCPSCGADLLQRRSPTGLLDEGHW